MTLRPGRVTALMGRNGSGKSTLLWTMQGTRSRRSGTVAVHGVDPAAEPAGRRRELVGLVPQTAADLLYLESVRRRVCAADAGTAARGSAASCSTGWCRASPTRSHPRDLSEGQRLALALAVVLVTTPPVLLLDEPTSGLDYPAKAELAEVLRRLADDGHAVMVATHDVEFAAEAADEVVVLAEGEVVSSGPTREVLAASPAFAPQVTKILGPGWLRVVRGARGEPCGPALPAVDDGVRRRLGRRPDDADLAAPGPAAGGRPGRSAVRLPGPAAGRDRGGAGRGHRGRARSTSAGRARRAVGGERRPPRPRRLARPASSWCSSC